MAYANTAAYIGARVGISRKWAQAVGRPAGETGTVTTSYECNYVGVTLDGRDYEIPVHVGDLDGLPAGQA
jgi:hypothetical protein